MNIGIGGLVHDSNVCILKDGVPIFIGEEERFCREKRRGGFPNYALSYFSKKFQYDLNDFETIIFSRKELPNEKGLKHLVEKSSITNFEFVDHHVAHASSTFYPSPFKEAAILTLDGLGDGTSSIFAYGKNDKITELKRIHYLNSLGIIWMRTGWFLGFQKDHFFSGAKVMALGAYGTPKYSDLFAENFKLHSDGTYELNPKKYPIESIARFWGKEKMFFLKDALNIEPKKYDEKYKQIHFDIAASMQKFSEDLVLHMLKGLHHETQSDNLCLAGGVALNCLQNYRILEESPFKNIFIIPSASDSGDSIGASLYHYHSVLGNPRNWKMENTYLGASYTEEEIIKELEKKNIAFKKTSNIEKTTAFAVSQGKVVGWFQGRAEIGPRALGNRSIIADPRNSKMRDYINFEIKHREWFRPYSPSVLEEHYQDFFEIDEIKEYMLFAIPVKEEKRKLIPAVMHVDGTSRIQTVNKTNNPKYYNLINEFYQITGVPMVLNTSFNDNGEPIVNSPRDAINMFMNSKLDCLTIGDFFIERSNN